MVKMKKSFSRQWISSKQTRKQRKYRYNAPLHVRHKLVSAHLSPILRERYGKRSLPVRKGDEVKVMRGGSKGIKGIVERVNLSMEKVYVEAVKVKKSDGSEVMKALRPSNLMITTLSLDDKSRLKVLNRVKGQNPAKKAEPVSRHPKEKLKPAKKPEKKPEKKPKQVKKKESKK